jgi:hypothetical protein
LKKVIKISSCCPGWDWIRQSPNNDGHWDNCIFVHDQNTKECGYWLVYENITKTETTLCPKQNTILIIAEPPTKKYHYKFLKQFSTVISCQNNLPHPNVIESHPSLPWMIGYNFIEGSKKFSFGYKQLSSIRNIKKSKVASVICSEKTIQKGHKKRLEFVRKLKEVFGEKIDFFGKPFNPIEDKWNAIAHYKYHIAIENTYQKHYWTEKISDAFLAHTHPIYYGCPNIEDYFPSDSMTKIDINNYEKAFETIEKTIDSKKFEESETYIKKSKKLVLDEYNLLPRISSFISDKRYNHKKESITLHPHEYFYGQDLLTLKAARRIIFFIQRTKSIIAGK